MLAARRIIDAVGYLGFDERGTTLASALPLPWLHT
jgi:hypothetical protein